MSDEASLFYWCRRWAHAKRAYTDDPCPDNMRDMIFFENKVLDMTDYLERRRQERARMTDPLIQTNSNYLNHYDYD